MTSAFQVSKSDSSAADGLGGVGAPALPRQGEAPGWQGGQGDRQRGWVLDSQLRVTVYVQIRERYWPDSEMGASPPNDLAKLRDIFRWGHL